MTRPPPLAGIRVVELAGLAPGPFCGLVLADYGASVLRIDGPRSPKGDVLARHKSSLCLDLKHPPSRDVLLELLARADVLIDPFRPGVLERLGLSPHEVLLKRNPRLVVARLTGFRRDGKYRDMAGHDINYLAVSGVLSMLGRPADTPLPPANLLGDFAGGGAMCVLGILMALVARQAAAAGGAGQVVEANMVDGSAYLATMPRLATKTAFWNAARGENVLDGGCPWYDTYRTKQSQSVESGVDEYVAVGALEPRFYDALLRGLGLDPATLPPREDKTQWPALRSVLRAKFAEKTRKEWEGVFDGLDACVTPVLGQAELEREGFLQRLPVHMSHTPGKAIPHGQGDWTGGTLAHGFGGEEVLSEWTGWAEGVDYTKTASGIAVRMRAKL
ncbi:isopenicillin n-CoA epimerase [Sodiomyces alkalinus F11]|uniref:Isopenicillin n-CoA epimerase n=1 Tax=Sodiomyces alkalinus (strain CBS 110278 / VKM F-3762 / F11) TaxID=1314773 RepID=A0A3N2PL62_SODAK|nr:isopenicillin n-CoA epimerase [Sodiomyces alkalinus F11]ROT35257.1 isopenicillin n-CoA epimerase [Sodiomyces alkalinus F11]